jgi:hypothetical protein
VYEGDEEEDEEDIDDDEREFYDWYQNDPQVFFYFLFGVLVFVMRRTLMMISVNCMTGTRIV